MVIGHSLVGGTGRSNGLITFKWLVLEALIVSGQFSSWYWKWQRSQGILMVGTGGSHDSLDSIYPIINL